MFIGHFAPAFVAAIHRDAPSLPVLFIGAQLVDWAFFASLPLGIEAMRVTPGISVMNPMDLYHMPYTHSLVGSIAWAAGFALVISLVTRNRTAALIGFAVEDAIRSSRSAGAPRSRTISSRARRSPCAGATRAYPT